LDSGEDTEHCDPRKSVDMKSKLNYVVTEMSR